MAKVKDRRKENIAGDLYVDSTCIDCDTCRWMAANVFKRIGNKSAVYKQPLDRSERIKALQALLSCPTASIGTVSKPTDIQLVQKTFPLQIEDNVYHCGYHSASSYGAASYFIRLDSGNILIDSPRFTPPLVKRLKDMGGVRYMYLTHKDDVADHHKFHEYFKCSRILHSDDINTSTVDVEIKLNGIETTQLIPELLIIPVPGHTKGHTVLLYQNKYLFTGDHLALSPYLKHLYAFKNFCWYSWSEQIFSMEKLADYSFEWVLPGHGHRYHSEVSIMKKQMEKCLSWMKKQ